MVFGETLRSCLCLRLETTAEGWKGSVNMDEGEGGVKLDKVGALESKEEDALGRLGAFLLMMSSICVKSVSILSCGSSSLGGPGGGLLRRALFFSFFGGGGCGRVWADSGSG